MGRKNWMMGLMGLIASFAITLLVYWYLENSQRKAKLTTGPSGEAPDRDLDAQIVIEEAQPTEPDDLTLVEGIGPKTSSALQNAGINTYTQLAASDTDTLKGILNQAGVRVAVSDTWTEQAGLAAAGDWNALEALQTGLKGGRRDS